MSYSAMKNKGFIQDYAWVGLMLLVLAAIFASVAIVMQIVPINPESVHVFIGRVRQPQTIETVDALRRIMLLVFGILGAVMGAAGIIIILRAGARRAMTQALKETGAAIAAYVTGMAAASVPVNARYRGGRLMCTGEIDGQAYIFKSDPLRLNPMPYLNQGQVTIYYDPGNLRSYFVDVDGSAGIGSEIIEL